MAVKPIDRIELTKDDIVNIKIDAIVNPATPDLLGGTGTTGRIFKVAGPELREACKGLNGCVVGCAKSTKSYSLPCRRVIHTVGPIYIDGKHREDVILSLCYKNCLNLLNSSELESIAFPLISGGQFGFPVEMASKIALTTIIEELKNYPKIKKVVICCNTEDEFNIYTSKLNELKQQDSVN